MQNKEIKVYNVNPILEHRLDCYRHALLPIVLHFGADIRPFLFNKHGGWTFNSKIDFEEVAFLRYSTMLDYVGLNREYKKVSENNIIEAICGILNGGMMSIVFIDTYNYKRFPASYLTFHSRHALPIYGYNKIQKTFNIIDSNYIESFSRIQTHISFDDLIYSHQKMVEYYNVDDYIEMISKKNSINNMFFYDYIEAYHYFMINNQPKHFQHLIDLQRFVNQFNESVTNPENIRSMVSSIYMAFNKAINIRHLEYTSTRMYFQNVDSILECLDKMLELYNYIRAIMYKYLYTGEYREVSIRKCSEMLESVVLCEEEYYQAMYKYFIVENICM